MAADVPNLVDGTEVEFLNAGPNDPQIRQVRTSRRVPAQSMPEHVAHALVLVAGLGVAASVLLPQFALHFPPHLVYTVDGWGRYHQVAGSMFGPGMHLDGQAPSLGAISFVGGLLVALTVGVATSITRRRSATVFGLLAFEAGVIVGGLLGETLERTHFPDASLMAGYIVAVVSTALLVISLCFCAYIGRASGRE